MPRIPIASIMFPCSENAKIDRHAVHRSLRAANEALREAAWSAPRRAYDTTEVLVHWADGEILTWQLDLQMYHAHEIDPIGAALREMAEKLAGLRVPHWLTRAAWDRYLDRRKIDRSAWRKLVEHYQTDDTVGEALRALDDFEQLRRMERALLPEDA